MDRNDTQSASSVHPVEPDTHTQQIEQAQLGQAAATASELNNMGSSAGAKTSDEDLQTIQETKKLGNEVFQPVAIILSCDDGGEPTELQKRLHEVTKRTASAPKALKKEDLDEEDRENRRCDALEKFFLDGKDILNSPKYCDEFTRRMYREYTKKIRDFFPEEIPLCTVTEEERLALIESANSRKAMAQALKVREVELRESIGLAIRPRLNGKD